MVRRTDIWQFRTLNAIFTSLVLDARHDIVIYIRALRLGNLLYGRNGFTAFVVCIRVTQGWPSSSEGGCIVHMKRCPLSIMTASPRRY